MPVISGLKKGNNGIVTIVCLKVAKAERSLGIFRVEVHSYTYIPLKYGITFIKFLEK